jgi:hypothetical protein
MRLWAGHSGADSDIDRSFSDEPQNDETVYTRRAEVWDAPESGVIVMEIYARRRHRANE